MKYFLVRQSNEERVDEKEFNTRTEAMQHHDRLRKRYLTTIQSLRVRGKIDEANEAMDALEEIVIAERQDIVPIER